MEKDYKVLFRQLLLKRRCYKDFCAEIKSTYNETFDEYLSAINKLNNKPFHKTESWILGFGAWEETKKGFDFWDKVNNEWLSIIKK